MYLMNAVLWTIVGLCLIHPNPNIGPEKILAATFVCALANVAWELLRKKDASGIAVDLKHLPRNKNGWEVMTEVKLDCWYSVIQSAERYLLVRSRQKLPKRFTTSEPVAISIDE